MKSKSKPIRSRKRVDFDFSALKRVIDDNGFISDAADLKSFRNQCMEKGAACEWELLEDFSGYDAQELQWLKHSSPLKVLGIISGRHLSHSINNERTPTQLCGLRKKALRFISAVAVPIPPPPVNDKEERMHLAEDYGFTQIGEPVPDNVTLKHVIDTLPQEAFEINYFKAWRTVVTSVTAYSLGIYIISRAPWYLLPLAWAWTGTAITGFFVIGHDCAHKCFSKNKMIEDIVGMLAFLPLIYPYEPWRIKHDRHHAKTNMLGEDTAWHPLLRENYDCLPLSLRPLFDVGFGPLRPWLSVGHWLNCHFDLNKFRAYERKKVLISLTWVFAFMAIGWPLIIYKTGVIGWFKFWLMPWLGYHFWMSTFTMVHHTTPHIPFKHPKQWNATQAQLGGTVHCSYPHWIELLCHDINVHIPHHISQRIPSYNLQLAQDSLRQNWGKYLNEAHWNWRLMKTIMAKCHIYDEDKNYVAMDEGAQEESKVLILLRRLMPNSS